MAKLFDSLLQNSVGYIVSLVIGAAFVMLLQGASREARLAVLEKRADEIGAAVRNIEKTLAEGGPIALAQRVDALSKAVESQSAKLDRLLELVARR